MNVKHFQMTLEEGGDMIKDLYLFLKKDRSLFKLIKNQTNKINLFKLKKHP